MANGGLILDYILKGAGAPSGYSFPGGGTGVPSLGSNSTEVGLYLNTSTNHLYAWDGTTWQDVTAGGASGLYSAYILCEDQEPSGTDGGTFTAGSWATRVLNTKVADTASIATLSSNQITLPAGTYRVQASAPAWAVDRHMLRVQNITDSTTLVTGHSQCANNAVGVGEVALLAGRFTLSAGKTIALQHQCQTSFSGFGLGRASGGGFTVPHETYARIELWQE